MRFVLYVNSDVEEYVLVLVRVVAAELEFLLVREMEAHICLSGAAVASVGGSEGHGERLSERGGNDIRVSARVAGFSGALRQLNVD